MSEQSVEVVSLMSPHADLEHSCIFTGVTVDKINGEHVIPNWMRTAYNLHHLPVEMGGGGAIRESERVPCPS